MNIELQKTNCQHDKIKAKAGQIKGTQLNK